MRSLTDRAYLANGLDEYLIPVMVLRHEVGPRPSFPHDSEGCRPLAEHQRFRIEAHPRHSVWYETHMWPTPTTESR